MHVRPVAAAAATARAVEQAVSGKPGADADALQLAASSAHTAVSCCRGKHSCEGWRPAPALQAGRASDLVRCKRGG